MPVTVINSKDEFTAALKDAGDKLVVVDFFAEWCGPCKRIAPWVAGKSDELEGKVVFLKVDVDEVEDVAAEYKISAMPTFLAFKESAKVGEVVGASQDAITALLEKHA